MAEGQMKQKRGGTKSGAKGSPKSSKTVRDVMTPDPISLIAVATAAEAAKKMKEADVGALVVLDDTTARVCGIVTDRDIVIRSIAEDRDPSRTTLDSICSKEITTLSPDEPLDDAVRMMRTKAVRRLPVVDDGKPVGIVSLGDLAVTLDRRSALADISAAPANT